MKKTFKTQVDLKYHLYNSLFLRLPFDSIHQTGVYLPILIDMCTDGFDEGKSPSEIIELFFNEYFPGSTESEKSSILFNFIKYIERQVVLFDSVEDAAFGVVNDLRGVGTVTSLIRRIKNKEQLKSFNEKVNNFNLNLVLTAHPTQFYPGSILEIINNLNIAIQNNNVDEINELLMQLGKTPFLKSDKPSPYDEAKSLIWYLENVLYESISDIVDQVKKYLESSDYELDNKNLITIGFWPGGDRDGNPYVNSDITRKVSNALKTSVLRKYYSDICFLKTKLTFRGTFELLEEIEEKMYLCLFEGKDRYSKEEDILVDLYKVRESLVEDHNSIFLNDIDSLINKVKLFGLHFAGIDIRQNNKAHHGLVNHILKTKTDSYEAFQEMSDSEKINYLSNLKVNINSEDFGDPIHKDVVGSLYDIKYLQENNGEKACHRYIISNCSSALDIFYIYFLARSTAWPKGLVPLDIVPLFETIDDLENSAKSLDFLYNHKIYSKHLKERSSKQTVMLGFSDGTKDGGYLSANWEIYQAKVRISEVSRKNNISLSFFDGRGGPPARGGGNTNKFYSSLGKEIAKDSIEVTIQGQTISSNFGTIDSAKYNIEQLLYSGIDSKIFHTPAADLSVEQKYILDELACLSLKAYQGLKTNDKFLDYLLELGPLNYYAMTNIGSRPAKRSKEGPLRFEDLRAITFVGTWSQLKQNVPGYYGLGKAIEELDKNGKIEVLKDLYNDSLFFKAIIDNSMQSMCKTFFPLTAHISKHDKFGKMWNDIFEEYKRAEKYILIISGQKELMEDSPAIKESIKLRESIMLPLLTIQQYALEKNRVEQKDSYSKMVMRTMFGIINASRNSA